MTDQADPPRKSRGPVVIAALALALAIAALLIVAADRLDGDTTDTTPPPTDTTPPPTLNAAQIYRERSDALDDLRVLMRRRWCSYLAEAEQYLYTHQEAADQFADFVTRVTAADPEWGAKTRRLNIAAADLVALADDVTDSAQC